MKTELSRAGHACAVAAARILSAYLSDFSSPVKVEDPCSLRVMRRELTDTFAAVRKLRSEIPTVRKGPDNLSGLIDYAARVWGELIDLESTNRRLDFSKGELWLIPELPTLARLRDASTLTGYPRKITGDVVFRDDEGEPRVIGVLDLTAHRSAVKAAAEIQRGIDQIATTSDEIKALGARVEALGLLGSEDWTFQVSKDLELVGVKKPAFERMVNELENYAFEKHAFEGVVPISQPDVELPREGFWIAQYQDDIIPVEVCTSFDARAVGVEILNDEDDPGELVVLLPGVGTERPLDHVRLLWPVKVWTEVEIMVKAGQLLADHGLRPESFRAFVTDLVKLVGGVK